MPSELSSQIILKFDGKKAEKDLIDCIISVEVDNSVTLPDMFSIHLQDDEDFKWIDSDKFKVGTSVEIIVKTIKGDRKEKATILSGEITGLEPSIVGTFGPSVVLRGYDKSHRLHRGRKTKAWLQVKDSDIASRIASDAGLGGGTVDATSGVHEYIIQDNKTDWEFLLSRARRVGRWVFVKDGKLNFVKNPGDSGPTLTFGDDLMEFSARLSTMRQVNEVEVLGWDPGRQEPIVGKASSVTRGTLPDIGESQSGGDSQKKAFSSAAEIVVDMPVADQNEAKELAQSFRDEREKDFIVADCVSFGNPKVLAGVMVKLEGVGKRFSGTYRVTRTLHRYTNSEYITEFTAGGRHSSITELLAEKGDNGQYGHWPVFGKVTNIDDPDNENRVKIKLPSLNNDVENTWARLVAPGASEDRGLQWLPEVNDEVLVVFERGDPSRPVVLGGVWSKKLPAPFPTSKCIADGKVNQRVFKSRSGHLIIMSDEQGKEMITIRDKTGKNEIVIDSKENTMTLKADKDVAIEAKGQITVKSSGGDLSLEGKNLTVKAQQNLNLQATGSCSIKSNQNCTLEGTVGLTMKNAAAQIALSGPTVNINNGALEVM